MSLIKPMGMIFFIGSYGCVLYIYHVFEVGSFASGNYPRALASCKWRRVSVLVMKIYSAVIAL